MNHPGWFKHTPERTKVDQTIMMPESGTNLERAHDIMDQMNLKGEVVFRRADSRTVSVHRTASRLA